jgi:hypothetical protein
VCSVEKKWTKDKQNAHVIGRVNNQTLAFRLAHEWKHVHMIFKGMFIRSGGKFFLCRQFGKETYNWGQDETIWLLKGGT